MSSEAFVTLATTDDYGLGALVLAESIRKVGTKRSLVVLISNHLSDLIRQTLEISFDKVIVVDELNSNDIEHLRLLSRPELGITFTKINCWLLEQYSKCVFLDADCVVLRSIDDLFEREEFSAAPDAGWPDCFNSGVFVYRPSKETFTKLMLFASQQNASFDGGDQGLLNGFFSNWRTSDISRHLPFTYNVTANAFYSYLPAVTRFRNDIHVVHFAGALKPWQLTYNPQNEQLSGNLGGQSDIQRDFLLSWWTIMYQQVWPNIIKNQEANAKNKSIGGEGQFGDAFTGSLNYGYLTNNQGIEVGSAAHRRAWEAGHIDYYGRDSFSNIQQQLERNIAQNENHYPSQQNQTTPEKPITSILKHYNKEPTPPLQQTSNGPTTSLKETPPPTMQQQNENLLKQSTINASQNLSKQQTTNDSQNLLKQQPTNVVKSASKETTAPLQQQQQSTNVVKSALKETTAPLQQQQPTNVVKSALKETTAPLQQQQPTNVVKSASKETTALLQQQQPTNVVKSALKETTVPLQQQQQPTNVVKSALKETTVPLQQQQQSTNVVKSALKETTAPLQQQQQSTNVVKSALKESTTSSQRENLHSLIDSNESKHSTSEHQSNWTVKSTITTAYTPGVGEFAGPTVVSKVVSESSATSSSDIPIKSSIKPITDSTKSSDLNVKAKTSNDHFAWLFDKLFVAISYTISLCYFLFRVAIRRSKNTNIIHGNGTSVRGVTPSTNNGNRVNK